jgi:hypothetical protein
MTSNLVSPIGTIVECNSSHLQINIIQTAVKIKISQQFVVRNAFGAIECMYKFTLPDPEGISTVSTITGLSAVIEDQPEIIARVTLLQKARDDYDDAMASNKAAFLLSEISKGHYELMMGNILPDKTVDIHVEYDTELRSVGDDMKCFCLPLPVLPSLKDDTGHKTRISTFMRTGIEQIWWERGQNAISLKFIDEDKELCETVTECRLSLESPAELWVSTWKSTTICAFAAIGPTGPRRVALSIPMAPPVMDIDPDSEIVFLIDCSGSMSGEPMLVVKVSMKHIVKQFPRSVDFLLIRFGSIDDWMTPHAIQTTEENLLAAEMFIETQMSANLGGTNIFTPLEKVYSLPLAKGKTRQIFLLTDGAVENSREVVALVKRNSDTTRVFTFGLGRHVSRTLVNDIAKVGNGRAWLIPGVTDVQTITYQQLMSALRPAFTGVSFEGLPEDISICTRRLPPLFEGEVRSIYAFGSELPKVLTLKYIDHRGIEQRVEIPVIVVSQTMETDNVSHFNMLHTLAARAYIRDVDDCRESFDGSLTIEEQRRIIDISSN